MVDIEKGTQVNSTVSGGRIKKLVARDTLRPGFQRATVILIKKGVTLPMVQIRFIGKEQSRVEIISSNQRSEINRANVEIYWEDESLGTTIEESDTPDIQSIKDWKE